MFNHQLTIITLINHKSTIVELTLLSNQLTTSNTVIPIHLPRLTNHSESEKKNHDEPFRIRKKRSRVPWWVTWPWSPGFHVAFVDVTPGEDQRVGERGPTHGGGATPAGGAVASWDHRG